MDPPVPMSWEKSSALQVVELLKTAIEAEFDVIQQRTCTRLMGSRDFLPCTADIKLSGEILLPRDGPQFGGRWMLGDTPAGWARIAVRRQQPTLS